MAQGVKTGGRRAGTPNKTTALLKDAILKAAEAAGGDPTEDEPGGIISYLEKQAKENPGPFMALLGKVLPLQIEGGLDNTVRVLSEKPITKDEWANEFADMGPTSGTADSIN